MSEVHEGLTAEIATAMIAWTEAHCRNCHKPIATDEDWQQYDDGEGEHLCWGDRDYCGFGCDVPRENHLADALVDLLAARDRRVAGDALRHAQAEWASEYDIVTREHPNSKKIRAALRMASVLAGERADLIKKGFEE